MLFLWVCDGRFPVSVRQSPFSSCASVFDTLKEKQDLFHDCIEAVEEQITTRESLFSSSCIPPMSFAMFGVGRNGNYRITFEMERDATAWFVIPAQRHKPNSFCKESKHSTARKPSSLILMLRTFNSSRAMPMMKGM